MRWTCIAAGVVGFIGGLITGAAGSTTLADKLIELSVSDGRGWQIALLAVSGLVGAILGAGASLALMGCLNRDR